MTIQDAFKICPDLKKISMIDLTNIMRDISDDENLQIDINKTFEEHGFNIIDCIEIVMRLENKLRISINDDVADSLFSECSKPDFLIQEWRESQINKILK